MSAASAQVAVSVPWQQFCHLMFVSSLWLLIAVNHLGDSHCFPTVVQLHETVCVLVVVSHFYCGNWSGGGHWEDAGISRLSRLIDGCNYYWNLALCFLIPDLSPTQSSHCVPRPYFMATFLVSVSCVLINKNDPHSLSLPHDVPAVVTRDWSLIVSRASHLVSITCERLGVQAISLYEAIISKRLSERRVFLCSKFFPHRTFGEPEMIARVQSGFQLHRTTGRHSLPLFCDEKEICSPEEFTAFISRTGRQRKLQAEKPVTVSTHETKLSHGTHDTQRVGKERRKMTSCSLVSENDVLHNKTLIRFTAACVSDNKNDSMSIHRHHQNCVCIPCLMSACVSFLRHFTAKWTRKTAAP